MVRLSQITLRKHTKGQSLKQTALTHGAFCVVFCHTQRIHSTMHARGVPMSTSWNSHQISYFTMHTRNIVSTKKWRYFARYSIHETKVVPFRTGKEDHQTTGQPKQYSIQTAITSLLTSVYKSNIYNI